MSICPSWAANVKGYWKGEVASLPLVFHLFDRDGELAATLDSPKQGAKDIPCESAVLRGDSLFIEMPLLRASFRGGISSDGNSILGVFTQGRAFLMTLVRTTEEASRLNRPQEPKPPFLYNSREVSFSHDGITLAGTLTTPMWGRKHPAVVLVSGSGAQNRDEEIAGHKPFAVIADRLTKSGIAVLRYDDRGIGGSSAGSPDDTTLDFAQDALAAIDFLKEQPDIDPAKIGVIGHSEGGIIAYIAAARRPNDVAFAVSLAGPAVKGKDLMIEQNRMIAELAGQPLTPEQESNVAAIFTTIDSIKDADALSARLRELMLEGGNHSATEIDQSVKVMTSPWYVSFVRLDPSEYIASARCPILALNGEWDMQVSVAQNLEAVKQLNPSVETNAYPGLNHLFQETPSRSMSLSYGAIDQTISPQVLDDIARWIVGKATSK